MSILFRKRVFQALAQSQPEKHLPIPPFQASAVFPYLNNSFNPTSVNIINEIIFTLHSAMNILTEGRYNFQILKSNSFLEDSSHFPDKNQKNIFSLSKMIYQT